MSYNNFTCIDTTPWPYTPENPYPFPSSDETPDNAIARIYLQFLWLPESLMPLTLLIPSLQRVLIPSSVTPHPLHDILKPLLLPSRAISLKYHKELPLILSNGGGEGEVEETMMWFAYHHEKNEEEKGWFERLERREVQIQILLNMYILTLPGPFPPPTEMSSVQRRKTPKAEQNRLAMEVVERRLETLMDKLSVWGLMGDVEAERKNRNEVEKEEGSWMEVFYRDVVEPQNLLPEQCDLLASKVTKRSPFEDEDEEEEQRHDTRPLSPDPLPPRPAKRARTMSSRPEPLPRQKSRATLDRSRSRSLSISLAQEQHPTKRKQPLNREISMSRTFKPKPKPKHPLSSQPSLPPPVKKGKEKEKGVTLVQGTPVKSRTLSKMTMEVNGDGKGRMLERRAQKEEIWEIQGSPNLVLGRPDEEEEVADGSPKRKRRA